MAAAGRPGDGRDHFYGAIVYCGQKGAEPAADNSPAGASPAMRSLALLALALGGARAFMTVPKQRAEEPASAVAAGAVGGALARIRP